MHCVMSTTVCVCSPRADVIHSRDGMLCLCHLEVSNSSLSAMFVIYHRVVNMFNSSELISISCDLHAATDAPSRCQHEKKKYYRNGHNGTATHTGEVQCLVTERIARSLWAKPLLNELLIDSTEMSSPALE